MDRELIYDLALMEQENARLVLENKKLKEEIELLYDRITALRLDRESLIGGNDEKTDDVG